MNPTLSAHPLSLSIPHSPPLQLRCASMALQCSFISLPFHPIPSVTLPLSHSGRRKMSLHVLPIFPLWGDYMCMCAWVWAIARGYKRDRVGKTSLQSRCPSICAYHSLLFLLFFTKTQCPFTTFSQRRSLHGQDDKIRGEWGHVKMTLGKEKRGIE